MKKEIKLTGLMIMLCALASCSKQAGQANSGGDSIAMHNIYSIRLNGAAYLLTEFENTGNTRIKAFQGKWTMKDDLGNKVTDDTIKFTSDTQFANIANTNDATTGHVIAPGEKFVMVEQSVSGQQDNTFVVPKKEDLLKISPLFEMVLKENTWEQLKASKTATFELKKVVSP